MRRIAVVVGAFAAAQAGTGVGMTVAAAAPMAQHVVGEQCIGAEIGRKDLTPSGQVIICDGNYRWEPYAGQTPSDPWVAGQR
ncbi:hypothetical protein BOO86_27925 [Mycobacterium sp. CBMA 234]|uniref:hypothetical protein n=1 Tax=Mycolicibacterium sp. CBMA 234 TaxID=1918495 RepID=UPI0012DCF4E4|nr:hypothetical protein [Mycolicibacterium sp. CBMA 234]MUL68328.1 hypothetical protein [Mycolicibacterium sp. CBMA 234]